MPASIKALQSGFYGTRPTYWYLTPVTDIEPFLSKWHHIIGISGAYIVIWNSLQGTFRAIFTYILG